MAIEETTTQLINESTTIIIDYASFVGKFALALQALGIIAIIYLIYLGVNTYLNFERLKEIKILKRTINRLEKKVNALSERRKAKKEQKKKSKQ